MAYLKIDSTPAQQELRARAASQVIADKSKVNAKKDCKSYSITSRDNIEGRKELSFFKEQEFGRG